MKNLIKTVLGVFIKSKIEQRKQKIKAKLEKEISTTTSEWVKARNTGFLALIEELIKIVPEENIILDPFIGSGTTAVAAKKHNRNFIGIEKSEIYYKIAMERLK